MPRLSAATALSVNPGARRSARAACRRSCVRSSSHAMLRTSRTSSENRSNPPNATSAARRAAAGSIPLWMFFSVSMSMWNANSSDIRPSVARRSTNARSRRRQARTRSVPVGRASMSGALENQVHRIHVLVPALRLGGERSSSRCGQRVESRRAILCRRTPLAFDPPLLLESLEGGVERSLSNTQQVLGLLLDGLAERPSVHWTATQRLQDQQVEGAAKQVGL